MKTGILSGWRGDISVSETAIALAIVLVARCCFTIIEDKLGSARNHMRRTILEKYLRLVLLDGPAKFRALCFALVMACLFVVPTELALYGIDVAAAREADDDA